MAIFNESSTLMFSAITKSIPVIFPQIALKLMRILPDKNYQNWSSDFGEICLVLFLRSDCYSVPRSLGGYDAFLTIWGPRARAHSRPFVLWLWKPLQCQVFLLPFLSWFWPIWIPYSNAKVFPTVSFLMRYSHARAKIRAFYTKSLRNRRHYRKFLTMSI